MVPSLRRTLVAATALLAPIALLAGCAPKPGGAGGGGTGRGGHVTPTPGPAATPNAWRAEARTLLSVGLGSGRPAWSDPPMQPGEKLTWLVTTEPPSKLRHVSLARDRDGVEVRALHGSGSLVVALGGDAAQVTSIAWQSSGASPVVIGPGADLDALWTPPALYVDSSFKAAGGTFFGNEVVRVPAGTFRARHGLLRRKGIDWHFYVARAVPGGLVKLERFPEGATSATLVLELESFTRNKRPPPPPPPTPPPAPTPTPRAAPSPAAAP